MMADVTEPTIELVTLPNQPEAVDQGQDRQSSAPPTTLQPGSSESTVIGSESTVSRPRSTSGPQPTPNSSSLAPQTSIIQKLTPSSYGNWIGATAGVGAFLAAIYYG